MDIFGSTLESSDLWLLRIAGALALLLIASIVRRSSIRFIARKKVHTENVARCLIPFQDAIANIHLGEHNAISIMRGFLRTQKEAIAIFKSQCGHRETAALQETWDKYEQHYTNFAKDALHFADASIAEPLKTEWYEVLHKYLDDIIKAVKKT